MKKNQANVLNRLGFDVYLQDSKVAHPDIDGEAQFLRCLMYLADYGTSAAAVKKIKKVHAEAIPDKLVALHAGGLKHTCLFSMVYDCDRPGGAWPGRFVAIYSSSLSCGVCVDHEFETDTVELIDAFDYSDGSLPPVKTIRVALNHLGQTPPPSEFTNHISSTCGREVVFAAVAEGEWKSEFEDEECKEMLDVFKRNSAERPAPIRLF